MAPRIIGLCGAAGAGKDEAAKALVAAGWQRDALADRMRAGLLALNPAVAIDNLHQRWERLSALVDAYGWDKAKREHPEVRRLLQAFGTEAGRNIHGQDCWVKALFADWDRVTPLVVADVRFDNEAAAIWGFGGKLISIERPGLEALPGDHASELGIDQDYVNYTVINDGTVEDLHRKILEVSRSD